MTPDRTGDRRTGCYRIDRVFRGVGRVRVTSGTRDRREFLRRDDILSALYDEGRLDVLCALRDRRVTVVEVVAAYRQQGATTLAAIALVQPLWGSIRSYLDGIPGPENRSRQDLALAKLQSACGLGAGAKVRDLGKVDWTKLRPAFRSAADWNHMRRALSAFLSTHLRDERHPFRVQVMNQIEAEREHARTPDLSVEAFWARVRLLPAEFQAPVVTIAALGLRVGEYIHADASSKRRQAGVLAIHGKTGSREVAVPSPLWPWVDAAIPASYARAPRPGERNSATPRYQRLQKAWKATGGENVGYATLHDLRHLMAQLASDAGFSNQAVATQLGHATPTTTARYTRRTQSRAVADAVAGVILPKTGT